MADMALKAVLILVIAIVVLPLVRQFVWHESFGHDYRKRTPEACRRVERTSVGSEDLQITSSGLAFITSGLLFRGMSPKCEAFMKSKGPGRIEFLDMNAPFSSPLKSVELTIQHGEQFDRETFRPEGLSLLEDEVKGEHLLYVVSHVENEKDRVEKFRYLPQTKELLHLRSFYSDLFHFTTDLVLLGEDKFYISNFLDADDVTLDQTDVELLGSVVYFDGSDAFSVLDNVMTPNGVAVSKDGRYFYVASYFNRTVQVYERHSDLDLRLVQEVALRCNPDNFHADEDGDGLLVGCHPNVEQTLAHLADPEIKSSSEVLHLPLKDGQIVVDEITQDFYDDGDLIKTVTVAGVYRDKLLLGSVIDTLVLCQTHPQ